MVRVIESQDPQVVKRQELVAAQAERYAALLEYVAAMADVELPEDEESEMVDDE